MERKYGVGLIVAVLAISALAITGGFKSIQLQEDDLTLFGRLLGTLVIVAAIMERALDMFLTILRGKEGDDTATMLGRCRNNLDEARKANRPDLSKETAAVEEAEKNRNASRAKTRALSVTSGVILGVVVSAFGFRALETLVDLSAASPSQASAFSFLDVILTGAVLAGGSDGLHKLVEVYRNVADKGAGNR